MIKLPILGDIAGSISRWPLLRQLAGDDPLREAAKSAGSERVRPRLEEADRVATSVCPYCGVGCGQLIYAKGNDIIHVEGDPRNPINQGTLCPKGAGTLGWLMNPDRLTKVKYRAPYSTVWEERDLNWAMDRIAHLTKRTRDETFVEKLPDGNVVNHTLGIASLGGATLDNEENYLIKKVFGAGLGMIWIENQARICHSGSVPSLGSTYGRGASTMAEWDLAKSDCVMIMGSNMAEAHPITFRFVMQAKERGATVIHIDPRFTRTSALADVYAPIRAGSDIAFTGGLIRYILENDAWFKEYALHYTNIATIIGKDFQDTSELDGVFSGWNEEERSYSPNSWQYQGQQVKSSLAEHHSISGESYSEKLSRTQNSPAPQDLTLQHERCVYQIMRRHYAAYTPEAVERITGCPKESFLKVAEALVRNSGREKTSAWCYAVGVNHHTVAVQMIRAAAIIQALLGNTGRPGGGVIALRGHASIQGSTDIPTLYNLLPGYIAQPHFAKPHHSLKSYLQTETLDMGWWHNLPKYMVSLLRAWYGEHATKENEWGYTWLPKIMGDHSQLPMTLAIADRLIRGLFIMGQNPAVGGHNTRLIRRGMANLEWMVVRETFESETADFWLNSPEVENGELDPRQVATEIFLLPASLPGEKEGTFTNLSRLIQWHDKVVDSRGDCRSDLWFMFHLGRRLKELYANSSAERDRPIQCLTLDYSTTGPHEEPSAEEVLKEINGYTWPDRRQIPTFKELKDDGSTACGCWIYCGAYPKDDFNHTRSRRPDGPDGPGSHLNWAFAWPGNYRTLYNRASADLEGKPWSEAKKLLWWNGEKQKWEGFEPPDFPEDKPPDHQPNWLLFPKGTDAHDGRSPFTLISDGHASLFVTSGLKDGPLPTHYEPVESPVRNNLYKQQDNPAAKKWERPDNRYHEVGDPEYPYVLTTYRLTELHCGGSPTRFVRSNAELQPEGFAEIPFELAENLGIANLDWVVVSTARGAVKTRALVTRRMPPLVIQGKRIYQIGMPYNFGWRGFATGQVANTLTSVVGDPNTSIHEGKALTCNLRPARIVRGDNGRR